MASEKEYIDQIINSPSVTIIIYLFFEGKTPLKKSLNQPG